MLAVRLHAPGEPLRLEDVPLPEPPGTEVRVRVAGCGVCHTDLHIVDGTQPRVELPGHPRPRGGRLDRRASERMPVGSLRRRGSQRGEAVVVSGGWGCGECRDCRGGDEQRCERPARRASRWTAGTPRPCSCPIPATSSGSAGSTRSAPLRWRMPAMTPYRAVRRAGPWLTRGAPRARHRLRGARPVRAPVPAAAAGGGDCSSSSASSTRPSSSARPSWAPTWACWTATTGDDARGARRTGRRRARLRRAPTRPWPTRPRSWRPAGWSCSSVRPAASCPSASTPPPRVVAHHRCLGLARRPARRRAAGARGRLHWGVDRCRWSGRHGPRPAAAADGRRQARARPASG